MVTELNSKNFKKEVLDNKTPVVVDFYASWCGPCKAMAPIVDELAKEMENKIKVSKVDIEDGESLAVKYGVMSVPTFLFFKGGKIIEQANGMMPKNKLMELARKILNSKS